MSIDALRGIAALAVLLSHVPHLGELGPRTAAWLFLPLDYGSRGVPLFLIISGFCIHLSVARQAAKGQGLSCDWAGFWRRRFRRLYPPYVAAIFFSLIMLLPFAKTQPEIQTYLKHPGSFFADLGTHLLLIHNLFPRYTASLGNGAFWSLGLEEQLYVLYAVLLYLRAWMPPMHAYRTVLAVTLAWFATGCAVTVCLNPPNLYAAPLWWPQIPLAWWAVWALGALAAEAYAGALSLPDWCFSGKLALACAALGVLLNPTLLHWNSTPAFMQWFVCSNSVIVRALRNIWLVVRLGDYAFAMAFFIWLNRWVAADSVGRFGGSIKRWLAAVGVFSYSLYLTHVPVVRLGDRCLIHLGLGQTVTATLIRYAILVPVCLGVAFVFFKTVESKFLNSGTARPLASAAQALPAKAA